MRRPINRGTDQHRHHVTEQRSFTGIPTSRFDRPPAEEVLLAGVTPPALGACQTTAAPRRARVGRPGQPNPPRAPPPRHWAAPVPPWHVWGDRRGAYLTGADHPGIPVCWRPRVKGQASGSVGSVSE